MKKVIQALIINLSLIFLTVGCSTTSAPLEFSPPPSVVEKAIAFILESNYDHLSYQLQTKSPTFEINKIDVKKIEPIIIYNFPVYHLEGIYEIKLKLNKNRTKIIKNKFQVDIQRSTKGETWRVLRKYKEGGKEKYFAHQIL